MFRAAYIVMVIYCGYEIWRHRDDLRTRLSSGFTGLTKERQKSGNHARPFVPVSAVYWRFKGNHSGYIPGGGGSATHARGCGMLLPAELQHGQIGANFLPAIL